MLIYKNTQERIDALIGVINEYEAWVKKYGEIKNKIKEVTNDYEDSANTTNVESEELVVIIRILRIMNNIEFTNDDSNTRLGDLKRWCEAPVQLLRQKIDELVSEDINFKYFVKDEDE